MRGARALLLVVAGTFDAEPLYVTGAALLLLGAGALAWIGAGSIGAQLSREIGVRSVIEEQPLQVKLLAKAGRLPLPPGWIDEPLLPEPLRLPAGRRQARVRIEVTFGRRGRRQLPPPALVLRDPFGLAQRVISGPATDEVLVLPRIFPVSVTAGGGDATPAHARASLLAAAETEIDGLRPWREGSPASRIHWQSFARGAGLFERKLISEADSRPIVIMDPRAPASPEALDAAVRAAGSLAVHFARRTGCSLLLPGDRRASVIEHDMAAWPALHVRLALLGEDIGPSLATAQNRRGLVIYVAARPVDRAPRGLGRTPGGCLVVVPGQMGGRRAILEVAGCYGYPSGRQLGRRRRRGAGGRSGMTGRRADAPRARRALAAPDASPRPADPRARHAARPAPRRGRPAPRRRAADRVHAARRVGRAALDDDARAVRARPSVAGRRGRAGRGRRDARRRAPADDEATHARGDRGADPDRRADAARGSRRGRAGPAHRVERARGRVSRAIEDLPGIRVPYRGLDEWVRTVIPLGGSALVVLAAVLAFWPRRTKLGFPGLALLALMVLYVVPVVALIMEHEFWRGAAFTLLMVLFLRLEKLRRTDALAAGRSRSPPRSSRSWRRRCSTATSRGSTTRRGPPRPRPPSRRPSPGATATTG